MTLFSIGIPGLDGFLRSDGTFDVVYEGPRDDYPHSVLYRATAKEFAAFMADLFDPAEGLVKYDLYEILREYMIEATDKQGREHMNTYIPGDAYRYELKKAREAMSA